MANDVNANIRVNLDTSQALAGLQSLQSRISTFNQSVIQSNSQAVAAQRNLLSTLQSQIGASGQFATSIANVENSVGRLQTAIDKNKLSMGQYFKYGIASSKNFGRIFAQENEQITRLATERVKRLQTQYIALGESQNGMTKALQVRPLQLFNADMAIATQKSQLFNKLLSDGSTSLVNWGKNTQWAGRQLMVGFTVPLTIFGGVASKIFMDLEKEAINFRKVYGDIFTTEMEVEENLAAVKELSKEMTKYGIAVKDTMALAGVAAQSGLRSADLMAATEQATRLAVLGQMEQAEAMETVISMQTAFQQSNEQLAESVDFLNIIENQTVLSLQDVAGAIPRAAPVIQGLGGDVKDLAVLLVAMREGGVSAAEGANALKNSLARLITPTSAASGMARDFGINLEGIVERNKGEVLPTIIELANAMKSLEGIDQQRLLSTIFGKFQYARIGALFKNITNDSSQAARAIELMGMSTEELAQTADQELSVVEDAIGVKFTGAVELLKAEIAPVGEQFLKLATPLVEFATKVFQKFNELSPTVKNFVTILTAGIGVIVPVVLMLVGLFGNLIGNLAKGITTITGLFSRLRDGGDSVQYLSGAQLDAAAAAGSLEGQINGLTGSLNVQREAVDSLAAAYRRYVAGANAAAANLPQGFRRPAARPARMASGGMVGGVGNKDTEPALLTPGEFVINADASKKFAPLLAAINEGRVGKYARGRVPFRIGGQTIELDVASQQTQEAINRRIAEAASIGEEALRAFAQQLQGLTDQSKVVVSQVDASLRQVPELRGMSTVQEKDYSAPEFIRRQTETMDWESRTAEIAAVQSRVAEKWQVTEQQVANLINTQASHLRVVDENGDRIAKSWTNVANLAPDLGAINNYLNRTERMTFDMSESSEIMQRIMRDTQLSYQQVLDNVQELQRGTHPQDEKAFSILTSLAKIDEEMSLAAVQAKEVKTALGTVAKSGYQASAVVAVGQARTAMPPQGAYVAAEAMTNAAVAGAKRGQLSASDSKKMMGVGDDFVGGYVTAINSGRDDVVRASQAMTEAAVQSVASGTSDIRVLLKEKLGVGPIVEQEQANLRENIALRKEENRLIERKMMLMASRGASTFGLRERAIAEIARERSAAATPVSRAGSPFGLTMGPKSVQDDLIKATKSASAGMNNVGSQASQTAKRFSGLRGGISKFGGTLKSGSMKMQGAFFALDGLVFAASMMNNGLGQVAQKALPLVFGIQGLTMVLPLLSNPIVLAGAALTAVAAGMWMIESKRKEAQQKIIDMSIAADGSAKAFRELAEELGTMRPTQRFAAILSGVTTEEEQQSLTEGQEFLESESGKAMIERARQVAGAERLETLQRELTEAISLQIITPEQAKSIASAIALSLEDPALGQALVSSISQYVRRSSESVSAAVNEMLEGVEKDVDDITIEATLTDSLTEEMERLLRINALTEGGNLPAVEVYDYDEEGNITAIEVVERLTEAEKKRLEQLLEMEQTDPFANIQKNIGPALNASTKLAEAQALVNTEYRRGNISSEEFASATDRITEKQQSLKNLMTAFSEDTFGPTFGKYFDMAAKSIGLTQEELDAINTQAGALEKVLQSVGVTASEEAANLLRFAMASGQIDSQTAGLLPELMQDKRYKIIIDQVIEEGDPGALAEIIKGLSQIEMFPEQIQTKILATFEGDWEDPAAVNRWLQEALINSSFFVENPNIQMQVMARLTEDPTNFTTAYANQLEAFYKQAETELGVNLVVRGLVDVENAFKWLGKVEKTKDIKKLLNVAGNWKEVFKAFSITYEQFDKLPDLQKAIILDYVTRYTTIQQNINLAETTASQSQDPEARRMANQFLNNARGTQQGLADAAAGIVNPEDLPLDDEEDRDTSGGSKEKSFLENLREGLNANAALYLDAENGLRGYMKNRGKFFGAFQALRKRNVPEEIIASLGTGPEAIKKARELLNLGKKELEKLIKDFEIVSVGEVVENARRRAIEEEEKARAARKTIDLDPELQQIILADKELTTAIATTKKGTPEYEKLMKVVRRLARAKKDLADATATEADKQKEATDAIDEAREPILADFARREALFQQEFGKIERHWQPILDANEKQIDLLQEQVDAVQREIDAIERLNDADERRIRGLERQKEMLQRQIEAIERQNEMDQRRIEQLNREDEIRGRVAEKLQKELDVLSDQENKIRDSYQKRIDALDKVAEVNDYIINQQKQQLGLSQAISEGDIYAATQAAQEMRAESSRFSQDQLRSGLEQGMENEVAGLRTPEGLTREEAEERIRQIQEQSYQTSLKIREIEDLIYQRNLEMIPIKDQQYNIDQQIQGIQDIIYSRESQILDIQVSRLQPLQDQLSAQQQSLSNNQKALADAKAAVRIEGQTYDELQNQISAEKEAYEVAIAQIKVGGDIRNSVENIRKKWVDVTQQIAAAVRTAKQLKDQAEIAAQSTFKSIDLEAAEGRITADTAASKKADAAARRDAALAAISQARDAEIAAALSFGTQALRMAAGGMINKIKGYRGGGIVSGMQSLSVGGRVFGSGARDSVPAMLTPGEFVIRKAMVDKYGQPLMQALNQGSMPKYQVPPSLTGYEAPNNTTNAVTSINAPVYNTYDMKFSINGANQSADEIANKVMFKMNQLQNQQIRGNRGY